MGVMIEGRYQVEEPAPQTDAAGTYQRARSNLRDWITPDGPFLPDPARYHLYVSWSCPWAHRVLIGRAMLGLEDVLRARAKITELDRMVGACGSMTRTGTVSYGSRGDYRWWHDRPARNKSKVDGGRLEA